MKKNRILPLLVVAGVLGLSGCSNISPDVGGSGESVPSTIMDEVGGQASANYYYLSSSKTSVEVNEDYRPIQGESGEFTQYSEKYVSSFYKGNVAESKAEVVDKTGLGSVVSSSVVAKENILIWIGDAVAPEDAGRRDVFLNSSYENGAIKGQESEVLKTIDAGQEDDTMQMLRLEMCELFTPTVTPLSLQYSSSLDYVKISDKVIKGSISEPVFVASITNPKYPSDESMTLQALYYERLVITYELDDTLGWIVTSMWSSLDIKVITDLELHLLDESISIGGQTISASYKYSAADKLPEYVDEKVYTAPDPEESGRRPVITCFDKETKAYLGIGIPASNFHDVTESWNALYGTDAKSVFVLNDGIINVDNLYYYSFTNVAEMSKDTPVQKLYGVGSMTFIPAEYSSSVVAAPDDAALFTIASTLTQLSCYIAVIYKADGSVSIQVDVNPGNTY